jgi:hypothetical protein
VAHRVAVIVSVSLAALVVGPHALAASGVSPADGATTGLRPEFTVRLEPGDTQPQVMVSTQRETTNSGFATGMIGLCVPAGDADRSCKLTYELKPGTYYWLVAYQKPDLCQAVGDQQVCFLQWHVGGPYRFIVSTKPPRTGTQQPTPPGPPVAGSPAPSGTLARPTAEGGKFSYAVPEAPPAVGRRAVVHYVTSGLDAPPLNDDDGDGVPDYVEDVRDAADTALEWYGAEGGFRPPLPDRGGPDPLPDIYVKHLAHPDIYGLAVSHSEASGGAFVIVSPHLDRSPKLARASISTVVAHEVFHVVQFAYVPDGTMPPWVAEGTATAMSLLLYPKIADLANLEHLDAWLREPWRSLADQRFYCNRCYGGAWWWVFLSDNDPKLLAKYFERLGALRKADRRLGRAIVPLDAVMRRRGHGGLGAVFSGFSIALQMAGLHPAPAYAVRPGRVTRTTGRHRINGLSTHYIPLVLPAGARGVSLAVRTAGRPLSVAVSLGGPRGRLLLAANGRIAVRFRSVRERRRVMLIITAPRPVPVAYRLAHRSLS